MFNSRYIRLGEKLIEAPILYENGYLLTIQPDYKTAHFATIPPTATSVTNQWTEELKQLEESSADNGGATAVPNPVLGGMPTAGAVAIVTGAAASITKAIH